MSHQQSDVVRRVIKHERQSLVVDAQIRQRLVAGVSNDYLSVILERGYISQQKLDYKQWLRFSNTSTGTETLGVVTGRLYGKTHTSVMDEQVGDGAKSYRNGSLEVTDNLTLAGGNFIIYDSVKQTKLFSLLMMTDMLITKVYYIGMLVYLLEETSSYIQHLAQKTFSQH